MKLEKKINLCSVGILSVMLLISIQTVQAEKEEKTGLIYAVMRHFSQ
jgi:hypothetical protein